LKIYIVITLGIQDASLEFLDFVHILSMNDIALTIEDKSNDSLYDAIKQAGGNPEVVLDMYYKTKEYQGGYAYCDFHIGGIYLK
jgi:hypothetical protein